MAIAGGACTAYVLQRSANGFTVARRTLMRDLCDEPHEAMARFLAGAPVRISGDHIEAFRRQCELALNTHGQVAL